MTEERWTGARCGSPPADQVGEDEGHRPLNPLDPPPVAPATRVVAFNSETGIAVVLAADTLPKAEAWAEAGYVSFVALRDVPRSRQTPQANHHRRYRMRSRIAALITLLALAVAAPAAPKVL